MCHGRKSGSKFILVVLRRIASCPLPTLLVSWRIHCPVRTTTSGNFVCTLECDYGCVTFSYFVGLLQKMQRLPRIPRRRCRYVALQSDFGVISYPKWPVAHNGFMFVCLLCSFVHSFIGMRFGIYFIHYLGSKWQVPTRKAQDNQWWWFVVGHEYAWVWQVCGSKWFFLRFWLSVASLFAL